MAITVVVADHDGFARHGLMSLLAGAVGIHVSGLAASARELLDLLRLSRPDVSVVAAGPAEGIGAGHRSFPTPTHLRRLHPRMGLVVLAGPPTTRGLEGLPDDLGALAYLRRDGLGGDRLADAVRAVARGDSMLDAGLVRTVTAGRRRGGPGDCGGLTPRELQVLSLIAGGGSNRSVAGSLVVTERAVEKHVNSIYRKLGISGGERHPRVTAVLWYQNRFRSGSAQNAPGAGSTMNVPLARASSRPVPSTTSASP